MTFVSSTQRLRELVMQFVDYDTYKKMMNSTGLAAVHDACANYTTLQFQTQRGNVQKNV